MASTYPERPQRSLRHGIMALAYYGLLFSSFMHVGQAYDRYLRDENIVTVLRDYQGGQVYITEAQNNVNADEAEALVYMGIMLAAGAGAVIHSVAFSEAKDAEQLLARRQQPTAEV